MSLKKIDTNRDLIGEITFRFFPYWPLFVILIVAAIGISILYLRFTQPIYEATATLLIKDERKGADDSRIIEQLNVYHSKKIVENEVEVIQSRTVMQKVVRSLGLYASVYERGTLNSVSAYTISPIIVRAKYPEDIKKAEVDFTFNEGELTVGGVNYPLDTWVETPYGVLSFSARETRGERSTQPMYFRLDNYKAIANDYQKRLSATPTTKLSTVVSLRFRDEDPSRAVDVLNGIVRTYNQDAIDDKNSLASNTLSFVDERLAVVKVEIDSIEKKIEHFKSRKGAVDLSEQGKLFLRNVSESDLTIAEINMQLTIIEQVQKYVASKNRRERIAPSTFGIADAGLAALLGKLYEAEVQFDKLQETTTENNPVLISLAAEIEKLRPTIVENIRNVRANLTATRKDVMATSNSFSNMLKTIPEKERELVEISRQQAIKNDVYSFLLQKKEETALSYAATIADSRIIDVAEASPKPVSPKKIIVFPAALVLSFLIGCAVIFLKENLNARIIFRSDIEELTSIPIAGELSKVSTKKGPFVVSQPGDFFSTEQFRQIRAAIGLYGSRLQKQRVLITSSISGEGKSFVASNLALSLALSAKKVVLVDLDLRNPKLSHLFGVGNEEGISDYLLGKKEEYEIIRKTKNKNLFVIGAGTRTPNPTELFLDGRLSGLFSFLEKSFDYVIIDSAPIEAVTDSYLFSDLCDTTLFIVRHDVTPKAMVALLDRNNKIQGLKNVQIVFNGIKSRGFVKGLYGYGYGYGNQYVYKDRYVNA